MGLTNTDHEKTFLEMMVATGDSHNDLAGSDHAKDGEDERDEETEQGQLRKDDEPGWLMGTIMNWLQQCLEAVCQKLMKCNKSIYPG
jgi:hypothetical protein